MIEFILGFAVPRCYVDRLALDLPPVKMSDDDDYAPHKWPFSNRPPATPAEITTEARKGSPLGSVRERGSAN